MQLHNLFILVFSFHLIIWNNLLFSAPNAYKSLQKNLGNLVSEVCHINKILLNSLTYNSPKHFTYRSHFSSSLSELRKIRLKLEKYLAGLYVKPFNKVYLLHSLSIVFCLLRWSVNLVLLENKPPQFGQLKHFSCVCVWQCSFNLNLLVLVKVQSVEGNCIKRIST